MYKNFPKSVQILNTVKSERVVPEKLKRGDFIWWTLKWNQIEKKTIKQSAGTVTLEFFNGEQERFPMQGNVTLETRRPPENRELYFIEIDNIPTIGYRKGNTLADAVRNTFLDAGHFSKALTDSSGNPNYVIVRKGDEHHWRKATCQISKQDVTIEFVPEWHPSKYN